MIKRERRHIDMGFQKIESFFFDIFGCGGGCNIVAPTRSADAPGRSYASLRPIDSVQQNEYYRSQSRTNANANGCIALGGRSKKSQHRKENSRNCSSKEIMIACDEDDDDNSFLNETGTTHPDSFFLDESCSSLSSSIVFDESRIPRVPLQALQDPPKLRPERKLIMIPTETVVGIWPPVVPVTVTVRAKAERMQEQREQLRRLQNPPPPKKEQEPPLPFPIRPPKIRRLTLDDALSIARYPLNSHQQPPSPPRQRFGNHPPCHDSTTAMAPSRQVPAGGYSNTTSNVNGVPLAFDTLCRSRSLDFLFPSKRHVRCKRENTKHDAGPRREHHDGCCNHHH
jgi:hypothetical protein